MLAEVENLLQKHWVRSFSFVDKYAFDNIRQVNVFVAEHQKTDPKMDAPWNPS